MGHDRNLLVVESQIHRSGVRVSKDGDVVDVTLSLVRGQLVY